MCGYEMYGEYLNSSRSPVEKVTNVNTSNTASKCSRMTLKRNTNTATKDRK